MVVDLTREMKPMSNALTQDQSQRGPWRGAWSVQSAQNQSLGLSPATQLEREADQPDSSQFKTAKEVEQKRRFCCQPIERERERASRDCALGIRAGPTLN